MNVSAIIVTRGDVSLKEVMASLPEPWEKLIWNNDSGLWRWADVLALGEPFHRGGDLAVYGRYAAIEYASHDVIYVQDDDCIVSDPQAVVDAWVAATAEAGPVITRPDGTAFVNVSPKRFDHIVCNMPQRFRGQGLYATDEHALVGFGAAFHRDAPALAFRRYWGNGGRAVAASVQRQRSYNGDIFRRTCDIVFTALTPRVLVDVPYENLPHAYADGRMYRQPGHQSERSRMLKLVRKVK